MLRWYVFVIVFVIVTWFNLHSQLHDPHNHNTQTVNAAAATIEAFVERRQHVLLEVIESLRSSFRRVERWNGKKALVELVIDPMMMQLVDEIKKYVTSTPCDDLNQHHALLGDVLKGVLDIVKHETVSAHKIIINLV